MLEIIPIHALKDNYIWLIIHTISKQCMLVDPGESDTIIKVLRDKSFELVGILVTHHHGDHTNGIEKILDYQNVPVFGPAKDYVATVSQPLQEGNQVDENGFNFRILDIPGHTKGHIAYYGHGVLFSGDTLFTGGCGRVFEGTMRQMLDSLEKLARLSDETLLYCGHEYTEKNLLFASQVEPNNKDIQRRLAETREKRAKGLPTVPAALGLEKLTNPFLRTHEPTVIAAAQDFEGKKIQDPIEVFEAIRTWKDRF